MTVRTFIADARNEQRGTVVETCIQAIRDYAAAGGSFMVKLYDDVKRTLDQNAAMWPALGDFAAQVPWEINGEQKLLEPEDWKDLLTAAFYLEVRVAPALRGGGFVMLGARTSKMTKREFGEFLEFLHAEGSDRGVRWSAPARECFDDYMPRGDADEG